MPIILVQKVFVQFYISLSSVKIIMKIKYLCCLFLIFSSFTSLACDCTKLIIGTWANDEYKVRYEFKDNSVMFQQLTTVINANYTIDTDKTPHQLTLTIQNGAIKLEIPALLKCVDGNTIIIEQFAPATVPTEFTEDGESMNRKHILTRML